MKRERIENNILKGVFVFVFVVSVFAVFFNAGPHDDFWWHAVNGKEIVKKLSFPPAEKFSYAADYKWDKKQWLFDVLAYTSSNTFSAKYIYILKYLFSLFIFFMIYLVMFKRQQGKYISITLPFALLGTALLIPYIHFTPWIFVFLFLGYFMYVLEHQPRRRFKSLYYSLPFITLLWTNMHYSAVLAVILFLIYFIYYLLDAKDVVEKRELYSFKLMGLSFAATVIAVFISPVFIHGPVEFIKEIINTKWHSNFVYSNAKDAAFYGLFYSYVMLMTGVILYDLKGADVGRKAEFFKDVLIAMSFFALALSNSIFIPVFLVITIPLTAYYVYLIFRWEIVWPRKWTEMDLLRIKNPIYIVLIPVLLFFAVYSFMKGNENKYPEGAVNYIITGRVPENIYAPYKWGSYLEYYLYPNYKVMISSRHEYKGKIADAHEDIDNAWKGYIDMISKYGINTFLLQRDSQLVQKLKMLGYRAAYFDDKNIIMINPDKSDKYLKDIYPYEKNDYYNIKYNLRAIKELDEFSSRYPSESAHLMLAQMYKDKDIDDAIDYLEEMVDSFPEEKKLYEVLGKCFFETEDYDSAVDAWKNLGTRNPEIRKLMRTAKKKLRRME